MTVGAAVTGITFGLSQLTTESEFMATVSVPIYSSAGQNVFMAFFQNFLIPWCFPTQKFKRRFSVISDLVMFSVILFCQ